jgi:hypothetical protein
MRLAIREVIIRNLNWRPDVNLWSKQPGAVNAVRKVLPGAVLKIDKIDVEP